jgi:hypothetical protein
MIRSLERNAGALLPLGVLLAGLLIVGPVDARTTSAMVGTPTPPESQPFVPSRSCWTTLQDVGFVRRDCTFIGIWMVPLMVDNGGSKTINVTALEPIISGQIRQVSCTAIALSKFGTSITSSGDVGPDNMFANQVAEFTLTGPNVPGGGYLFLRCQVEQGAFLGAINYPS